MESGQQPGMARLWIGLALWAGAFGLSLFLTSTSEPVGEGFTRALNRIGTFFRWQFLSFALAIFVWVSGRSRTDLPPSLRVLVRVPIYLQCLLGMIGVLVVAAAILFK